MEQTGTHQTINDIWNDGDQTIPGQDEGYESGISEPDSFDVDEEVRYQNEQCKKSIMREQGIWSDDFKASRLRLSSIKDIRSAPPLQYLVQDILIPGWTYLLSGLPGTGKSLWALLLAIAVASGKPFLNTFQVSQPGPVLIIDSENPGSLLKERFDKMGIPDNLPIKFLHYQDVCLDNDERLDDLLSLIGDEKPAMVILDSFLRFHSKSENSSDEMKIVTKGLSRIARVAGVEPATLTIHHAGKNPHRNTISRGSTEINAGVDVEYGMTVSNNIITFQSFKTRVESFDPIKLRIKASGSSLDMEVISLGIHVNRAELADVKSHLEEWSKEKSQSPNQGEFKTLIGQFYPKMGRTSIEKIIQDGIDLTYWREAPQRGPNNAILYEPM